MTRKAAKTGADPTALVAIEQRVFPESMRIVNDDMAYDILPLSTTAAIWWKMSLSSGNSIVKCADAEFPGLWGSVMCRKRYIDEKVVIVANGQFETLVNLGAGFDTRAYRLPALAKVRIWELDQPVNIRAKGSRLKKLFRRLPEHVTLVPTDFDSQAIDTVLMSYGHPANTRTFFIWEAVTQYLTEAAVGMIFKFLAKSPKGSRLVFTYICRDFIDGDAVYNNGSRSYSRNDSWLLGMDPTHITDFLGLHGWCVLEHLDYEELAELYVKPTGRKLEPTLLERIVYGEKL